MSEMSERETNGMVQPVGWNAKLVDWFIKNTQFAVLLFICVVVGGVASLASLRSEGFPSPSINVAIISTVYRGASSQEVEAQIVKPIEAAISGIAGVNEVSSTAAGSFGLVSANFDASSDFKAGLSELRSKVQNVDLPKDADKPEISVPSFGGNISLYAITGSVEPAKLRSFGEQIRLDLEALDGVKDFKLASEVKDKVDISFKSGEAQRLGITAQDVQQALQANNVTIPAGSLTIDGAQASVVTLGSVTNVDQLGAITIKAANDRAVKLADIATITPGYDYTTLSRTVGYKDKSDTDGKLTQRQALVYQLTFAEKASVLSVDAEVQKVLDQNREEIRKAGGDLVVLSDVAESIRQQVSEIEGGAIGEPIGDGPLKNLGYILGGIWLIVLGMLLFVSWRAALISALAVPLSLLITFLALQLQGVSLNTLTLFSMVLVLGLVVDPAIVVLEAIQRELDLGKRGRNAVIAAMNSVGLGVFMAVFTSVIVFVPFGVVSGIFGQIIRYIPITIIPALVASYIVPVLFLTFLAQKYLRPAKQAHDDEEIGNLWKSSQWIVRANMGIAKRRWLQWVIVVLGVTLPLGVTGALFATGKISPVQFSAAPDSELLEVTLEYPRTLATSEKEALVAKAESLLVNETYIQRYYPLIQQESSISLSAQLLPRDQRTEDSPELAKQLDAELKAALQKPEKEIFISAKSSGVGTPESAFPVSVNIYGDNLDNLKKAAIATGNLLREQPKVTRVEDGFTGARNPQVEVTLDRAKLNSLGISAVQVAGALAGQMSSPAVTKFEQEIDGAVRTTEVLLSNADKPTTVEQISSVAVGFGARGPILVKDVASVKESDGFSGIQRLNGSRFVTVGAKVADPLKDAAEPQAKIKEFWSKERLAEYGLREDALQSRGNNDEFVKSFKDLFLALGIAIVLLYISLVLFLKSFWQPFIILFAVPLTFLGVFPALTLVGGQFGFLEILGIITLSGIVVNVGIFLIDLANQKKRAGMDYRQAIAEASGIRFRPIFLTKVTTLAGLVPLMVLSPFWRSLALVVVSGVLVSGFLSLFTTPVLYNWLEQVERFFDRVRGRVSAGYKRMRGR